MNMMYWLYVGIATGIVMLIVFRKRCASFAKWIKAFGATYLVAVVVWMSGAVSSLSEAYANLSVGAHSAGTLEFFYTSVISVLILVSLAHQALVFHSMHEIDIDPKLRASLAGWHNTRLEWGIRLACVVMLLCVAGEIPHLVGKITALIYGVQYSPIQASAVAGSGAASQSFFAAYSAVLFLFLLLWDCGAKIWSRERPPAGEAQEHAYLKSDLLAFCSWLLIWLSQWDVLTTRWKWIQTLPIATTLILVFYTKQIWGRFKEEILVPSQKYVAHS